MNFLGLDIGTSSVKAVIVDAAQRVLASVSVPLTIQRPRPLWSEQDPETWWQAVEQAVAQLRSRDAPAWSGIGAIGLSGQMHGAILLDEQNRVIRPAILWNDGRSHSEAQDLKAMLPGIGMIAGVQPGAGLAAPKLLWLRRHEPESFRRIRHVLAPKDYVRFRMTGTFATDMCEASGMMWLDGAQRRWSQDVLAAIGLETRQLADLMEGPDVSGRLAVDWGLGAAPVAAGSGDAAAGAIGVGAISDGDAFITIGTSAQYYTTRDSYHPHRQEQIHAFAHGLPGLWSQIAAPLNGASCLVWAAELVRGSSVPTLLRDVEQAFAGPSPLLFLPYLTGERMPYNDPLAKGVLFGLTPGVGATQIILAVLEGVALSLADAQDCLARAGARPGNVGVIGGGARSRFWMRLLAAILNRPLDLYEGAEHGPAFGAARLARLAATGEAAKAICVRPEIAARIEPEAELVAAYAGRLDRFRALYQALAGEFSMAESADDRQLRSGRAGA